jgi:hypothetical protein
MKMTRETDVLKPENGEDLLPVFCELRDLVVQAARKGQAVHEVEKAIWEQVLRIGRQALGQFFQLVGSGDQGETVALPDGRCCQRLQQAHARRYRSIFGDFDLQRTVYGTREGQKIEFVPLDNRLQLPRGEFSYVLQDWDQGFCVEQAFGPSARAIARMLGLRQSVDSLERMNEAMAQDVVDFWQAQPKPKASAQGELVVVSADGKGIVMRRSASQESPEAKRPTTPSVHRRKGEKANQKRMATVGTAYTVDRYVRTPEQMLAMLFRDDERPSERRPRPQGKQVWASLSCPDDVEPVSSIDIVYTWLADQGERRDPTGTKEWVHLSDGQESLRAARQEYLPEANVVDIADILHVASYVWQAAHAFWREGSDEATAFVRERLLRILQGRCEGVVRGLHEMSTKRGLTGTKKKAVNKVCTYLASNRERMRYDEYLSKGYPIASGAVEGACRHLVKDRMERAGMHWTPAGAEAMLNVRSVYVNGDWDAYQTFRINSETETLYPFRKLVEGDAFRMAV